MEILKNIVAWFFNIDRKKYMVLVPGKGYEHAASYSNALVIAQRNTKGPVFIYGRKTRRRDYSLIATRSKNGVINA